MDATRAAAALAAIFVLASAAACGQRSGSEAAGTGSTGATTGSTAVGVPPEQTGRVANGPGTASTSAAAGGGPPPAAPSDAAAGNARTAAAELNPPDPGRPSANAEKGVTQPSPGVGNDHSSPQFGSATTR